MAVGLADNRSGRCQQSLPDDDDVMSHRWELMPDEQPAAGPTQPLSERARPERRALPERRGREWTAHRWVLPTIAVGGMLGASARHGLELAWPTDPSHLPWATFVTNVAGCAVIGLLMVYVVEHGAGHPLLRPFVGVGVLGGFTTFSTYAVQTTGLLRADEPVLAMSYFFGTVAVAMASVTVGVLVGRLLLAWAHARRHRAERHASRAR
jgi:CrcB protein